MARNKPAYDKETLRMALLGYERQHNEIGQKIQNLRNWLDGKTKPEAIASHKHHHRMSAEGRARIAEAQRKRWAEHRRQKG